MRRTWQEPFRSQRCIPCTLPGPHVRKYNPVTLSHQCRLHVARGALFHDLRKVQEQPKRPLWVKNRHVQRTSPCPLSAKSGRGHTIRGPIRPKIYARCAFLTTVQQHPHRYREDQVYGRECGLSFVPKPWALCRTPALEDRRSLPPQLLRPSPPVAGRTDSVFTPQFVATREPATISLAFSRQLHRAFGRNPMSTLRLDRFLASAALVFILAAPVSALGQQTEPSQAGLRDPSKAGDA